MWKKELYTFDLYDTVLTRQVPDPADVFTLVERRLMIPGFAKRRIACEKEAKAICNREVTLSEIYSFLPMDEGRKEKAMRYEREAEEDVTVYRRAGYLAYRNARKKGKRTAFVSDMYLPEETLLKILRKKKCYSPLFLSGTFRVSKKDGLLSLAAKRLQTPPKRIVHTGDSLSRDVLPSIREGITPCYLPRIRAGKKEALPNGILQKVIANGTERASIPRKAGYGAVGPLLFGFALFIKKRAEGADTIAFLARDGYLPYLAFTALFGKARAIFLKVSRRTLHLACLTEEIPFFSWVESLGFGRFVTVGEILYELGVSPKEVPLADNLLAEGTIFRSDALFSDIRIRNLLRSLESRVRQAAKRERAELIRYLKEHLSEGNCLLVDVGWGGSLQASLTKIGQEAGLPVAFSGCYLGLSEKAKKILKGQSAYAYVFDGRAGQKEHMRPFIGLMEMLLMERTGSVTAHKDGKAVRGRCELSGADADLLQKTQQAALAFVRDFAPLYRKYGIHPDRKHFLFGILRFGLRPTKGEARLYGVLPFENHGKITPLASIHADPRETIHWKTGAMKKVLLFPLPYEKLFWAAFSLFRKERR